MTYLMDERHCPRIGYPNHTLGYVAISVRLVVYDLSMRIDPLSGPFLEFPMLCVTPSREVVPTNFLKVHPASFHCESHASGNTAWIAVITSLEPPHSTKHEGNGATCFVFPNFNRPCRKKTLADPAISRCQ